MEWAMYWAELRKGAAIYIGLMFLVSLTDCSTTPKPVDIQTACPPLTQYTLTDQQEFAREERELDAKRYSQVIRFLGDYKAERDSIRACQGKP